MPHTKRVFEYFETYVIPFLKQNDCRSMLYVGWRHDCKPWWHDYMAKQLGGSLGVLEIFPKNVDDLERQVWSGRYDVVSIIPGDARDPRLTDGMWDVIFWDHGPEHVTFEELQTATPRLFGYVRKVLVYCCPWGDWPQGAEDGNEHEVHRNAVTTNHLTALGMRVTTFGAEGQENEGELVGIMTK
jgi:hypothetical protein